jgi:hypothetical protein
MLKNFITPALCLSLMTTSVFSVSAEDLVADYTQVHHYSKDFDKQYAIKALTQSSLSRWNHDNPLGTPVTVTYAFAGDVLGYIAPAEYDVQRDFKDYERNAIIGALNDVASFTNITFVEVTNIGETNFVFRISTSGSSASLAPTLADGDTGYETVSISDEQALRYLNPERGTNYIRYKAGDIDYKHDLSNALSTIYHEVGHVLGLSHPFSAGANTVPFPLDTGDENKFNTAMAYNYGKITSETYQPTSFRIYDVIALQHLYGKNVNKNIGTTLYGYDDNYDFHQVIVDAGGDDTIGVANSERNNVIDLRSGKFSSIAPNYIGYYEHCPDGGTTGCGDNPHEHLGRSHNSLLIDIDTVIENATGGKGDDILVANSVANTLKAGDGTDTAIFVGKKSDYTIEVVNSYTVIVTSATDTTNVDTLTDFEFLKFVTDFSKLGTDGDTAETVILNQPPVVTLPETMNVRETLLVTITATATDADNDALTYIWTQLDGTSVTLTNADKLSISFTAPAVDAQETINLQLVVSDGANSTIKTVAVNILANNMPSASIITSHLTDNSVDERTAVSLSVATTDADNDSLTYRWVVNGATVALTGNTTDTITFTAPDVTTNTMLTVEVFVSDGIEEVSATSTVTVKNIDTTPDPVVTPPKKESSGGSFGYLIFLIAGLRLLRK